MPGRVQQPAEYLLSEAAPASLTFLLRGLRVSPSGGRQITAINSPAARGTKKAPRRGASLWNFAGAQSRPINTRIKRITSTTPSTPIPPWP